MSALIDILVLLLCMASGYLLARFRLAPPVRVTDLLLKAALWALLLVMGFRMGSDPAVLGRLGSLGLLALVSAGLAVAGSLLALLAIDRVFRREWGGQATAQGGGGEASAQHGAKGGGLGHFRAPLLLLSFVVAGFAAGLVLRAPAGLDLDAASGWALKGLLFFIGMQFSQAGISLAGSLLKPATLLLPAATALGTILSGLALAPLFGLRPGAALALQAGFGWYSLSGILISGLGDPALGSASFLSNMAREAMAFVLIPFLARTTRPWLGIGTGGATAMDVTLPLVEQCAGPAWVPASFASGAILSTLVPILVPLLFSL
jgi:uncharacterized membrane protein YbjE (DUF340 family)